MHEATGSRIAGRQRYRAAATDKSERASSDTRTAWRRAMTSMSRSKRTTSRYKSRRERRASTLCDRKTGTIAARTTPATGRRSSSIKVEKDRACTPREKATSWWIRKSLENRYPRRRCTERGLWVTCSAWWTRKSSTTSFCSASSSPRSAWLLMIRSFHPTTCRPGYS